MDTSVFDCFRNNKNEVHTSTLVLSTTRQTQISFLFNIIFFKRFFFLFCLLFVLVLTEKLQKYISTFVTTDLTLDTFSACGCIRLRPTLDLVFVTKLLFTQQTNFEEWRVVTIDPWIYILICKVLITETRFVD